MAWPPLPRLSAPRRWFELIPLLSWCLMRGRCGSCGARLPLRYLLVEFFTAAAFVGLFFLDIVANALDIPLLGRQHQAILAGNVEVRVWLVFAYHALLLSLLILVSVCDLEHLEIPLGITVTGTVLGLVGAVLLPWPFPEANPAGQLVSGVYPWPVWYPLPAALPAGSWQLGLATGLAGSLVGMVMLRGVRFLFGLGRGIEGLGLGDADLMMMAGSFIGWQPILLAFFAGVLPALFFGLVQLVRKGDQPMPFGPSLAIGVLLTMFSWPAVGPRIRLVLFDGWVLAGLFALGAVFLLITSYLLRLLRGTNPV